MSNLDDVNKWAANECGVAIDDYDWILEPALVTRYSYGHPMKWDIGDARCRGVVREKFRICTVKHQSSGSQPADRAWQANSMFDDKFIRSFGEDIEEAEIACVIKLFEASHDR